METIDINVEKRELKGKSGTRKLRKSGLIPAVVYSNGKDSLIFSVDARNFKNLYEKGLIENRFFHLSFEGGSKSKDTLLKEIQIDPVSEEILHLDFYEVDINKPLDVEVPLKIVNENLSKGIVEDDGIIRMHMRSLNIHALPLAVPKEIEVDVKDLLIGDELTVKDMPVIEGLQYLDEPDERVVSLVVKKVIEITPEEEKEEEAEEKEEDKEKEADKNVKTKEEKTETSSTESSKE
jgi:large subunit ribosomal protein L25